MIDRDEAIAIVTAEGQPWEVQEVMVHGKPRKWFVNGPQTLRELYEQNLTDGEFLVYEDERYTFTEAYQRASSLAHHLKADFDVKPGDRVAIAMRNYPEWSLAFTAITSLGAIAVAINAWWEADEINYALDHTGISLVLADEERIERIQRISPPVSLPIISVRCQNDYPSVVPMDELLNGHEAMPEANIATDDDAVILFTSGSTGHPKGSVSTHRNIIAALLSWETDYAAIAAAKKRAGGQPGAPVKNQGTLLGMPLFHVNGLLAVLLSSYRTQRRVLCMYKWDPEVACDVIEKEQVTVVVATPAMTGDLTDKARELGRDLASLRSVGGGGAPRATSQVEGIDKQFKNATPTTGWGMTETNSIGTGIYAEDYLEHPQSSGRVSVMLEIAVVDTEDNFLPANERGELLVRGTSVIHGYWNRPDANEDSFMGDWFRTGDVAYIDEDGYLFIVDRIKQLIIRGGENIGCGEVEDALLDHPDVVEVSVYGVPDERLGENVGATIFSKSVLEESALREFLEARLAKFKIPHYVKTTTDALPRIASGKIDKRVLRQAHLDELGIDA
ncbi:MAG: class I adenylate-forming enzyme family protein [Nitrospira sp.]